MALYGRLYPEEATADQSEVSACAGAQRTEPVNLAGELSEFLKSSHGTNRPETDTLVGNPRVHHLDII